MNRKELKFLYGVRNGTLKDPDYVNAVASLGLLITVN